MSKNSAKKMVYQFKIILQHIKPPIWRRILVPADYSFFDLHSAIQDAMGWEDCHLHSFTEANTRKITFEIGIPDTMGFSSVQCLPGWKVKLNEFFKNPGDQMCYTYDFGDNWEHLVKLEKILPAKDGETYPKCIAGKRACPPEDCGSSPGYYAILDALEHPEIEDETFIELRNYYNGYDPENFCPDAVVFFNPELRLTHTLKQFDL